MSWRRDLGQAHTITLRPNLEDADLFTMFLVLQDGSRSALVVRREALIGLWAYLTRILYPRAVDITQRADTVRQTRSDLPPTVTYRIIASSDLSNSGVLVIGGFTHGSMWILRLDWETCENLWASIEHHLDRV